MTAAMVIQVSATLKTGKSTNLARNISVTFPSKSRSIMFPSAPLASRAIEMCE